MAFLNGVGKKISDVGQGVAQKTKNFTGEMQLNGSISDKQKRINTLFNSLGEAYYNAHKEDTDADHQDAITEINNLYAEIAQLQDQINDLKGLVKCPNCGASMPKEAAFCNQCGTALSTSEQPEQPTQDTDA